MKYVKIAQMPMMDPMAGMGMGMPAAPMAMPGAPLEPPSAQKQIKVPLANLGLILADAEIEKKLLEQLEDNEQDIANGVWMQYGGEEDGGVDSSKRGKRNDSEEATDKEIKTTDKTRWERLPQGQNLNDLEITLDDFANAIKFLSFGFAKNKGKEQGAGAAGGGMPGLASRKLEVMVKLAHNFDLLGMYSVADRIL
jgi:hypothetical protein